MPGTANHSNLCDGRTRTVSGRFGAGAAFIKRGATGQGSTSSLCEHPCTLWYYDLVSCGIAAVVVTLFGPAFGPVRHTRKTVGPKVSLYTQLSHSRSPRRGCVLADVSIPAPASSSCRARLFPVSVWESR